MDKFKVIIVEDVPLELKGTEGILRNEIPEAEIIGTADNEQHFWQLIKKQLPDLVLLDLGLGGSTTVGVEICRQIKERHPGVKVLIFTGEILNERLWVDALDAGCDGIILKSGELLTRSDVASVMDGKRMVFNQPILNKIVERFKTTINNQIFRQEALIQYEIDEYDERFLRHLALGYTKEQIASLKNMPFGVKSLEKRQNELIQKLFHNGNGGIAVNATRLVVKALQLSIIDLDNLMPDDDWHDKYKIKRMRDKTDKIISWMALSVLILQIMLFILSWIVTATNPDLKVRSLLSGEGVRWLSVLM